jgi:hypothetical protein
MLVVGGNGLSLTETSEYLGVWWEEFGGVGVGWGWGFLFC